jgi:soluble lytic murein transglycosylase-like protein
MNLLQFVKIPPFLKRLTCGVVLLSLLHLAKAEIYVSTNVNGLQQWSTQAIDATYTKSSIVEEKPFQLTKSLTANAVGTKLIDIKRKITDTSRTELLRTINQISSKYGVDQELIKALIAVESGFNTHAISPKGARGLMQLMPATAKRYGMKNEQELHVPSKNIDIGVRHLKDLLNLHNGQIVLAIAAYNAGQGAVSKHGQRIPSYRETMLYVPAIMAYMAHQSDSVRSAE